MKIAGFTFIKNAIKNDYPIVEAINSILPICDEFVIAVGKSDDDTLKLIESINSAKIRIIETVWDPKSRAGGAVFAQQTDIAFNAISSDIDWAFYIQGDECVHEKYLSVVKQEMQANLENTNVEGLLLKYKHFYGSYDFVAESRRWYRREIRVIKKLPGIKSYKDAQGFRLDNRKIKVKLIEAYVYHYGWVKPPQGICSKMNNFNQYYKYDSFIEEYSPAPDDFDYGNADKLIRFTENPPAVMISRIEKANWKFSIDPTKLEINKQLKKKLLLWIETKLGLRLFEYKNYRIVK
ncbi:MAG: glycosyltransferase family 2 protein [Arcicella sp.]|nr:glycosyltransferase family 2 protein [Arcicella sp.]